ncbi:MAG: recombinase family protein [Bacilli bacterium]
MKYAALYIRLSVNDPKCESINNQKYLLIEYCRIHEFQVYDIYIDNGYTGTNFKRPEFNRLLNDFKNFDIIITKDFSRLGRDYIETGKYIEKVFPENNKRYISILDKYDSIEENNDYTPFKFIINEMYSKDLSKKIRSSLKSKKEQGLFLGSKAPYGYSKSNYDLLINNEECKVVKKIYSLYLKGYNCNKIARYLSELHYFTPSKKEKWSSKTVNDILHNQTYIGDLVQGKKKRISHKCKYEIKIPKEDYIIVKKKHTPIISEKDFIKVQKKMEESKKIRPVFKYDGSLYCKECGHKISILYNNKRNKAYLSCSYYRKTKKCTPHSMNYNCLLEKITDDELIEKIIIDKDRNIEIKKRE